MGSFLRLVKAHKQQGKKRHVIAEAQGGKLGRLLPDAAANAAVDRAVAVTLRLGQLFLIDTHIAEHPHPSFFEI